MLWMALWGHRRMHKDVRLGDFSGKWIVANRPIGASRVRWGRRVHLLRCHVCIECPVCRYPTGV